MVFFPSCWTMLFSNLEEMNIRSLKQFFFSSFFFSSFPNQKKYCGRVYVPVTIASLEMSWLKVLGGVGSIDICLFFLVISLSYWNKPEKLVYFFVGHQTPFIYSQFLASYDCIVKPCGFCWRIWIIIGSLYCIRNPWDFITFWLKSVMHLCVISGLIFGLMREVLFTSLQFLKCTHDGSKYLAREALFLC